jgi:hypothetical protein
MNLQWTNAPRRHRQPLLSQLSSASLSLPSLSTLHQPSHHHQLLHSMAQPKFIVEVAEHLFTWNYTQFLAIVVRIPPTLPPHVLQPIVIAHRHLEDYWQKVAFYYNRSSNPSTPTFNQLHKQQPPLQFPEMIVLPASAWNAWDIPVHFPHEQGMLYWTVYNRSKKYTYKGQEYDWQPNDPYSWTTLIAYSQVP